MAKTKTDIELHAHQQGDADGLGMFRGAFCAFGIEVALALIYGICLFLTHPHTALLR